jgi:hypothetical protein
MRGVTPPPPISRPAYILISIFKYEVANNSFKNRETKYKTAEGKTNRQKTREIIEN